MAWLLQQPPSSHLRSMHLAQLVTDALLRICCAAAALQQASTAYASDADRTQAALAKRLKAAGMRVHT